MENNAKFQDILKTEGIYYKGFGIICKYVMQDTSLTITAKTIYAYLCSYAGNGTSAYPGRETILTHLQIDKSTYYRHYNQLVKEGYIEVKKENAFPFRNIYTLVRNPKKFQDIKIEENQGMLIYPSMKAFGYGMIPKAIMLDERLDVDAKGLYAYFSSYAGNGNCLCPSRKKILFDLSIGVNRYYKSIRQLIQFNYISVFQRVVKGRFSVNDFIINETPDEDLTQNMPCIQNADNENIVYSKCRQRENDDELPCIQNAYIGNAYIQNAYTNINNNNININNINNKEEEERFAELPLASEVKNEDNSTKVKSEAAQNNSKLNRMVIDTYTKNINSKIRQVDKRKLLELQVKFGLELLIKAIDVSGSKGGMSVSYVEAILEDWSFKGIRTPEDADKLLNDWKNTNNKARRNRELAIENRSKNPPQFNNNGRNNDVPQMHNYEERKYDDDFFKSLIRVE